MGRLSKVFDTAKESSLPKNNESTNSLIKENSPTPESEISSSKETTTSLNKESNNAINNESTNSLIKENNPTPKSEISSSKETTTSLNKESNNAINNEVTKTLNNETMKSLNNEVTKALSNENKNSVNKELVNLNFKVDVEIRRKIKQYAAAHDQSLKEVFEKAIEFYIQHHP